LRSARPFWLLLACLSWLAACLPDLDEWTRARIRQKTDRIIAFEVMKEGQNKKNKEVENVNRVVS
jgi:hypothetical protein